MILDLASFAFGFELIEGTGTPPWGTALGQHRPTYEFTHKGYESAVISMLYNAVPLKQIWMPIGRGGGVVSGIEDPNIQLASVFRNVCVNGVQINHPFMMIIYKEDSLSHNGRRHLKYSPKISYRQQNGYVYSNEGFISQVYATFELKERACWFVYEMEFIGQTILNLKAIFVNKENTVIYPNSKSRKLVWQKLVEQQNINL